MILQGKKSGKNFLACIAAPQKLDIKAFSTLVGEEVEFEKKERLLEKFGIKVGAVPPFGNFLSLITYFDSQLIRNGEVFLAQGFLQNL